MDDLDNNSSELNLDDEGAASDDSSSRHPLRPGSPKQGRGPRNGSSLPGYTKCDSYVMVSVSSRSKSEIRELKRKLMSELDQVKSLLKRVEAKEVEIYLGADGYTNSQFSVNHKVGSLMRVNSEVGSVGPPISRPPPGVTVSVADSNNGAGSEFVDKRTPKANHLHRNSKSIAGRDKFPPVESNKKVKKSNGGTNDNRGPGFGADKQSSQLFKSCSNLLTRLMKHKFGWVFNKPVDAEGLGLHDYFTIIKHPMDLGTVQTRLNKNWYKSPREFAEDVRLTLCNAMLYNPKGQDVHFMADTLLKMFEEKWAVIEKEHNLEFRRYDMAVQSLQTPTSKKAPTPSAPPALPSSRPQLRDLDRSESTTLPVESRTKPASLHNTGRTPVTKKPKVKDTQKREMTYEEKQKLSDDLQNLPSEKLENVVQIIKKRNPHLFQQEDEIEVDIDSVDLETLWELNQFVADHKKNMSKIKRKTEVALQGRAEAGHPVPESKSISAAAGALKENARGAVETNVVASSPAQMEKQDGNASRSNSSGGGSSSSGSGSSSSGN
ncbi:hypothetical protein CDL15_Pgr002382 [Punica granatum]|uniref:Transcription factor GTE4-like n=1 Tax=Punica granatum TaxID=22663 RepID=A0A218XTY2_PUNGR|nr:hypothetical protein CDL15_Pgr002382 [Punica granatum]